MIENTSTWFISRTFVLIQMTFQALTGDKHRGHCADLLCVVSVDCVEELLQFVSRQHTIREVGFEFVEGQFSIIWRESMNATQHQDHKVLWGEVKWTFSKTFLNINWRLVSVKWRFWFVCDAITCSWEEREEREEFTCYHRKTEEKTWLTHDCSVILYVGN